MSERLCLVHYHEIGLKGKNRSTFENQLVVNLTRALRGTSVSRIARISGYLVVETENRDASPELAAKIAQVPGVARVSLAYRTNLDEREYCRAAIAVMREAGDFYTFKVHSRRSSTNYPIHTLEMNQIVGEALCDAFPEKKVEMHHPDVQVVVHAVQGSAYVYAAFTRGVGGLPVGTAGKVVTLLSSGFDSPVATWMVGRRGAVCVPIHFSGRPMTADTSEYLCQDICEALAPSGSIGRLYVVPFGEHQRQISLTVPQDLRIIMYRRIMVGVAERLARIEGAKALVTGESLGQVASQTLDNIAAVDNAITLPVLRPLIGSDKAEIMERAEQIGTAEFSTQTAPDCCTLFMPKRPETHARLSAVLEAEALFDKDAMIDDLLRLMEYRDFDTCPSYHPPKCLRARHKELLPGGYRPELDSRS